MGEAVRVRREGEDFWVFPGHPMRLSIRPGKGLVGGKSEFPGGTRPCPWGLSGLRTEDPPWLREKWKGRIEIFLPVTSEWS